MDNAPAPAPRYVPRLRDLRKRKERADDLLDNMPHRVPLVDVVHGRNGGIWV